MSHYIKSAVWCILYWWNYGWVPDPVTGMTGQAGLYQHTVIGVKDFIFVQRQLDLVSSDDLASAGKNEN